jgi:hypothetical protein
MKLGGLPRVREATAMGPVTDVRLVSGTAYPRLAHAVAIRLRAPLIVPEVERFPDGEIRPAVERVRGGDVYVIQSTGRQVHDHLIELLLLLDACRRGGAERVTAVVPYVGYARQDRRRRAGEAVGARVVADAVAMAGPNGWLSLIRAACHQPDRPTRGASAPAAPHRPVAQGRRRSAGHPIQIPAPRQFLAGQAHAIVACDFLVVETVLLKRLSALVFIEHGTRRLHLAGVTAHPTGAWAVQVGRVDQILIDDRASRDP